MQLAARRRPMSGQGLPTSCSCCRGPCAAARASPPAICARGGGERPGRLGARGVAGPAPRPCITVSGGTRRPIPSRRPQTSLGPSTGVSLLLSPPRNFLNFDELARLNFLKGAAGLFPPRPPRRPPGRQVGGLGRPRKGPREARRQRTTRALRGAPGEEKSPGLAQPGQPGDRVGSTGELSRVGPTG